MTSKLDQMTGCFIKEEFNIAQLMVGGCESASSYMVYPVDKDGKRIDKKQFEFQQKSGCCSRYCLPADCTPMDLKVMNLQLNKKNAETEECMQIAR